MFESSIPIEVLLIFFIPALFFTAQLILILFLRFLSFMRYKQTSYCKITQRPHRYTRERSYINERGHYAKSRAKGYYGEWNTYKHLMQFEKEGNKLLFNVSIPKGDNTKTEIDIVMLSPVGIFVFESKNFRGSVFGNQEDEKWTQSLRKLFGGNRKETFYNPVKQNATHIKHLKKMLELEIPVWSKNTNINQIPIWSIIVFSDKCKIDRITRTPTYNLSICNMRQLSGIVDSIQKNTQEHLSETEIAGIFNDLLSHTSSYKKPSRKKNNNY